MNQVVCKKYSKKITHCYEEDYFDLYIIFIISITLIMILHKNIHELLLISLFVFGIALIYIYGKILYKIYNTKSWIRKNAKVVNVEIEILVTKNEWLEEESCYPIFEYLFNFEGKKFSSKVFSIIEYDFPMHKKKSTLKVYDDDISQYLKNTVIGSTVDIFFNPKNPSESVVKQGASKKLLIKYNLLFFIGMCNIIYSTFYLV